MAADASYYIDLIIRARDETARAIASAVGNQEKLGQVTEQNARRTEEANKRAETSFDRVTKSTTRLREETINTAGTIAREMQKADKEAKALGASMQDQSMKIDQARDKVDKYAAAAKTAAANSRELSANEKGHWTRAQNELDKLLAKQKEYSRSLDQIKVRQRELNNMFSRDERANAIEKQIVAVQKLSDRLIKLQADERASAQERLNANKDLEASTRDLQILMSKGATLSEALADAEARRNSQAIRDNAARIAQEEQINRIRERGEDIARRLGSKAGDDPITSGRMLREVQELDAALERLGVTQEEINRIQQDRTGLQVRELELRAEKELADAAKKSAQERAAAEKEYQEGIARLDKLRTQSERQEEQRRLEFARKSNLQRIADDERAARESIANEKKATQERTRLQNDYNKAIRNAAKAQFDADRGRQEGIGGTFQAVLDLNADEALAEAAAVKAEMETILGDIDVDVDLDIGKAIAQIAALKALASSGSGRGGGDDGLLGSIMGSFEDAGNKIATFDNIMRGLFTLAISVFFNQLIVLAGAAAGALLALGSAALQAGAALGGALTAGAMQAIPALGILVAAFARFKAVTDAVQQANLLDQQKSAGRAKGLNQEANAANAVLNATEGLADAQRRVGDAHDRVGDAQRRLTEARREAKRDLEDLILAEREAELASRGATLSQRESREALQAAIASGRGGDIERSQLRVAESDLGAARARRRLTRTRSDAASARTAGVEGAPGVRTAREALDDAREGVQDAERAVARAQRGLEQARRSAQAAGTESLAAAGKLEYLLGELSDSERELYEGLRRLQSNFRAFAQETTAPLIESFTRTVNGISDLLKNPAIVAGFTSLSTAMAGSFNEIFDALTSPEMIESWLGFMREFERNLGPLTDIAINLAELFTSIGEAAGPALRIIVDWIDDIVSGWAQFAGSDEGQQQLTDFFTRGAEMLQQWMELLGSVGNLFLAIAGEGGGAETGMSLLQRMTDLINGLAERIRESPEGMRRFFAVTSEIFEALLPLVGSVVEMFGRLYNQEGLANVQAFVTLFERVFIPALETILEIIGYISRGLAAVAENDLGAIVLQATLISTIVGGLGSKLFALTGPLRAILGFFAGPRGLKGVIESIISRIPFIGTALGGALRRGTAGAPGGPGGPAGVPGGPRAGARFGFGSQARAISLAAGGGLAGAGAAARGVLGNLGRGALGAARRFGPAAALIGLGDAALFQQGNVLQRAGGAINNMTFGLSGMFGIKNNKPIDDAKDKIKDLRGELEKAFGSKVRGAVDSVRDRIMEFAATAPPEVGKELQKLIEKADRAKKQIDKVFRIDDQVFKLGVELDLAVGDEKAQKKKIKSFLDNLFKQSGKDPVALETGRKKVQGLIDGMEEMGTLSKGTAEGLRTELNTEFGRMLNDQVRTNDRAFRKQQRDIFAVMRTFQAGVGQIVGDANEILKAFGVKSLRPEDIAKSPMALTPTPRRGRAGGGFLGNAGEREGDSVKYMHSDGTAMAGGEAVLPWQHQGYVNEALNARFGWTLPELFRRVRGRHGEGSGYAGGYAGKSPMGLRTVPIPGFPGEFIAQRVLGDALRLIRRFNLFVTDAFARSGHRGAGHLQYGTAMDVVPGRGGSWDMVDRAVAFARSKGLTVLYNGVPGHGRGHHAHIELQGGVLGGGAGGGDTDTRIRTPRLGSLPLGGAVNALARAALRRVRDAAQSRVDSESGADLGPTNDAPHGPKGALSINRVRAIFRRAFAEALPFRGFDRMQGGWLGNLISLAGEESSYVPTAQNRTAAGVAAGNPKGILQVIPATFRAYMKEGFGDIWNPLHNAIASIRYQLARYKGIKAHAPYASGGSVPGTGSGDTVPALLTPGEHVWTKSEVERAGGHRMMYLLRRLLGGGGQGGPFGYADGGIVSPIALRGRRADEEERHEKRIAALKKANNEEAIKAENRLHKERMANYRAQETAYQSASSGQRRRADERAGIYRDPLVPPRSVGGVRDEFSRVGTALRRNTGTGTRNVSRFIRNIGQITDDDGLLDQLRANIERTVGGMALALRRKIFANRANPKFDALGAEIENMGKEMRLVTDEAGRIGNTLGKVVTKLRRVKRQIATDDALIRRFDARIEEAREDGDKKEVSRLQGARGRAIKRRGTREEQAQLLTGQRNELLDMAREAQERIQELQEEMFQKEMERFQKGVEDTMAAINASGNRNIGGTTVGPEAVRRFTELFGTANQLNAFDAENLERQRAQLETLKAAQQQAQARGYTEYAQELQSQIDTLWTSIAESTAQQMQRAIENINAEATRASGRLDLRGRLAAVQASMGDALGAALANEQINRERGAVMGGQRSELLAQIGGRGEFERLRQLPLNDLTETQKALIEQIEELDVSIEENSAAQKDLTTATRQVRIDAITNRGNFRTGVLGGLSGILQQIGTNTGTSQNGGIMSLLTQTDTSLRQTGGGLRDELASIFGVDLRGLSGGAFVNAVSGLDFDALTAGMTEADKAQFEALINAIIDNEAALQANTGQMKELAGDMNPQTWSSTAWTWFNEAVFDGVGNMLPQYDFPQMHTGGIAKRNGLYELRAGEVVRTPEQVAAGGDTLNIEINEAGGPVDISALAARIAFAKKTMG